MALDLIYLIISNIALTTICVAFFCGLFRIKYLINYSYIVFLLILSAIITEIISHIIVYYFKMSNLALYNLYIIIESVLISIFYYKNLVNVKIKSFLVITGIILVATMLINLFKKSINTISEIFLTFESIHIIILTFFSFYQALKKQVYKNIIDDPLFWFNSAFLIYFSGNLFIHLFSNFLHEFAQKAFYEIWGVHSVLNIILYTLISIGFWKTKPSQI